MGQFLKFILVPLLVTASLLAAPAAMSEPSPSIDHFAAAHHDDGNGIHDECPTLGCCLLPAPTVRPTNSTRPGDSIFPLRAAILSGERPSVPAPPPKPPV